MKRLVPLIVLVMLGQACGGAAFLEDEISSNDDDGSEAGTEKSDGIPQPDQSAGAGAHGVVYATGESIGVVDQVSAVPTDAVPLEGVEVRLLDREGSVQATATTAADGSFSFTGIEITHAVVEVRRDPESEEADLSLPLTLVREKSIPVGASHDVDRQEAVEAAASLSSNDALVACTQNPLPEGTLVFPTFGNPFTGDLTMDDVHTVSAEGEWFCLSDENMTAQWAHPVTYIFISATDGTLTTETRHWLPSLNFIPIWAYEGDLFRFDYDSLYTTAFVERDVLPEELDVTASIDLVRAPTEEFLLAAEESLSSLREALSRQAISRLHIPKEDWFGFLWAGSPETWFFRDLAIVKRWAVAQGIPEGNITSFLHASDSWAKPNVPFSYLSALLDPKGDAQGFVARLAAKIKERRDNGGHPVLFVYSVSHGNSKGELLVVDNAWSAIGRYYLPSVFGDQLNFPIDELLPIHEVPACKIRWVLSTCHAATHLDRLMTAFSKTDQDVEIYTASAYAQGKGKPLAAHVAKSFRDAFNGPDDLIVNPLTDSYEFVEKLGEFDLDTFGTDMAVAWVKGSSLDPEFELLLSEGLKNSFHKVNNAQEIANYKNDPNRPSFNDRLSWDPNRPDPCVSLRTASLILDGGPISLTHHLGQSSCPQSAGSVSVTNTGTEAVTLSVADNHAGIDASSSATSLAPGKSTSIPVSFNCEVAQSFTSTVTVTATGSDSGQSSQATFSVGATVVE